MKIIFTGWKKKGRIWKGKQIVNMAMPDSQRYPRTIYPINNVDNFIVYLGFKVLFLIYFVSIVVTLTLQSSQNYKH